MRVVLKILLEALMTVIAHGIGRAYRRRRIDRRLRSAQLDLRVHALAAATATASGSVVTIELLLRLGLLLLLLVPRLPGIPQVRRRVHRVAVHRLYLGWRARSGVLSGKKCRVLLELLLLSRKKCRRLLCLWLDIDLHGAALPTYHTESIKLTKLTSLHPSNPAFRLTDPKSSYYYWRRQETRVRRKSSTWTLSSCR